MFTIKSKFKLTNAEAQALQWAGVKEKWVGEIKVRRAKSNKEFDLVVRGSHKQYGSQCLFDADLVLVCLAHFRTMRKFGRIVSNIISFANEDWSFVRDCSSSTQWKAFNAVLEAARSPKVSSKYKPAKGSKTGEIELDFNGTKVYAGISPCSWMYADYGLQFRLALEVNTPNPGSIFVNYRDIPVLKSSSMKERLKLTATKATEWLAANGTRQLEAALKKSKAFEVEYAQYMEAAKARAKKKQDASDAEHRKVGFTHRVDAWIHTSQGDDYQIQSYTKGRPNNATISKLLSKSQVKTDFAISAI